MPPQQQFFRRLHALFEMMDKLGVNFYTFHDRDLHPPGAPSSTSCRSVCYCEALGFASN